MSAKAERAMWEGSVAHIEACGKVLKSCVTAQGSTTSKRTPSIANATFHARQALIEAENYEREQFEAMRAAQREESIGDPDQMALDLNAEGRAVDESPVVRFTNENAFDVLFRVNVDRPLRLKPGEFIDYPNGAETSWTTVGKAAEEPADVAGAAAH